MQSQNEEGYFEKICTQAADTLTIVLSMNLETFMYPWGLSNNPSGFGPITNTIHKVTHCSLIISVLGDNIQTLILTEDS